MRRTQFIDRILSKREKLSREALEEILREVAGERDLLHVILDSMVEGVLVARKDGTGLYINVAAANLLDIRVEEYYEADILSLLPEKGFRERFQDCLENSRNVIREETPVETPLPRILELTVMPIRDHSGRNEGIVALFHDITQRKLAEVELKKAQKLADMTTLAARVSHEIRNPLNNLQIYTQLAERDMRKTREIPGAAGENLKTALDRLKVVREEIVRLNDVLESFLTAVRPSRPILEDVDLVDLVEAVLHLMGPRIEEKQVAVDLVTGDGDIPPLLADGAQLRLVLHNLIKNALEATGEGGHIHIELTSNSREIILKVSDDGIGIPEEVKERIFDPYFSTKEQGTGLGLVTVRRVVEDHGGRIDVESTLGEGTRFTVTLPRRRITSRMIPLDRKFYERLERAAPENNPKFFSER